MSDIINRAGSIKQISKSTIKEQKTKNQKKINLKDVIANNYVILNLIGSGSFGKIYLSFNLRDNIEVVIKKEIGNKINEKKPPQLKVESKIYTSLLNISTKQDLSGNIALPQDTVLGVPKFYGMGILNDNSGYYMIIEFLGPNLIDLFRYCSMNRFTLSTVCLLAIQMINRIENIHNHGFLHRDIKPENFLIGYRKTANVVYLLDFGLSKRYIMKKNNQHIPYREGRNLIGTARYISINTHMGIEQSRRDDLESIGYVLVLFLKGSLPWQGLKDEGTCNKFNKIMEKKLQIPVEILCLNLPQEMVFYFNYVKSLRFEDKPDYDLLRGFFINMLNTCQAVYDIDKDYLKFDWTFDDINHIWDKYRNKGIDCIHHNLNSPKKCIICHSHLENNNRSSFSNQNIHNYNNNNNNSNLITNKKENLIKDIKKKVQFYGIEKSNENVPHYEVESSGEKSSESDENINNSKTSISESNMSSNSGETLKIEFNSNGINKVKFDNNDIPEEKIDLKIEKIINKNNVSPVKTLKINPNEQPPKISIETNSIIEDKNQAIRLLSLKYTSVNDLKNLNHARNRLSIDSGHLKQNLLTPKLESRKIKSTQFLGLKLNSSEFLVNKKNSSTGLNNLILARRKSKQVLAEELADTRFIKFNLSTEKLLEVKSEQITDYYEILEDLELDESLGVYKRVRHKKLGQFRSMRIIKKTKENKKEIDILQKLSHPNILDIYEIFKDKNYFYVICENIEGKPLFEYIVNDKSFHEKEACQVMKEILLTVNYLHSLNIMHRDLKPESIVINKIDDKCKIKLVNFSTAIEFIPGKKLNDFIGTHYYVAPEVITKNYNELCDIWSCGIINYILITEYPPFQGKNDDEILHNIRFTEPNFKKEKWDHISYLCKDLISKMLNKNPKKRPSAEICLKHNWFKELLNTSVITDLGTLNQIKAVHKMAGFIKGNKFKQAVLQFMVKHFDLKHEEDKLNLVFSKFDVNGTGRVTKKVFFKELVKIYGEEDAKDLTNKIFGSLDLDGNGDISYIEFLTAIMDSKKLMTDDKLEKTFKLIDKNGDGKITIEEIKNIFGGDIKQWKKIIKELDKDMKDEIGFNDFKRIMTSSEKNMDEGSFESENFDEDDIYEIKENVESNIS